MSKYQEIAELAGVHATAFIRHRSECLSLAEQLRDGVEKYLEAPSDCVVFTKLDGNLRRTGDPTPTAELVHGRDGFWYFGLTLHFEGSTLAFSDATFTVGLRHANGLCTVRLATDFDVNLKAPDAWHAVFQEIERSLRVKYSSEPAQPRQQLGFVSA